MHKLSILAAALLVTLAITAAFAGMRMEFNSMQALEWQTQDPKSLEGYQWLANNTDSNSTVLAWWDYADGIKEVGHRKPVINEASENIKQTIGGYTTPDRPWRKIEYWLWYPYEPEDKVRDVANFFVAQNATLSRDIARKYGADYVLVLYPDDLGKFFAIVMGSGANPNDYFNPQPDSKNSEAALKVETVGTEMIKGNQVDGFEKAFDNGRVRIYKVKP